MRPRVFCVQPIPPEPLAVLEAIADVEVWPNMRRQITVEETCDGAKRNDYVLGFHSNWYPAEVIYANPELRGLAALGGMTIKVDFDAALEMRVPIVSSLPGMLEPGPGGVGGPTADLTVSMILALAYRLLDSDRYTRADETFQEQTMALMGIGLAGKKVGLVGLGRIAVAMVKRLLPFGCAVLYTKRSRLTPEEEAEMGIEYRTFDALLAESDFVCVEVSYGMGNTSTRKMFGDREFSLMKPTAYFINTARGRIVDEDALIRALQNKTIAGGAFDVYYREPEIVWGPVVPRELREMDNVILVPHNGNATYDVRNRQVMPLALGIKDLIEGRRPPGILNPEVWGEPVLHPEFYGRGPVFPIDGGPDHFLAH